MLFLENERATEIGIRIFSSIILSLTAETSGMIKVSISLSSSGII